MNRKFGSILLILLIVGSYILLIKSKVTLKREYFSNEKVTQVEFGVIDNEYKFYLIQHLSENEINSIMTLPLKKAKSSEAVLSIAKFCLKISLESGDIFLFEIHKNYDRISIDCLTPRGNSFWPTQRDEILVNESGKNLINNFIEKHTKEKTLGDFVKQSHISLVNIEE